VKSLQKIDKHIQTNLRPILMHERYRNRPIAIVGDPAGTAKSSLYEENEFDLFKRHGYSAFPAATNDIDTRLRAVETWLLEQRAGEAAILISGDHCPKLVRALSGGYKYGKTRDGKRKPLPEKDEFSHPADALQYACMAALGGQQLKFITNRLASVRRPVTRPPMPTAAWT
jgi:hypothetical protein